MLSVKLQPTEIFAGLIAEEPRLIELNYKQMRKVIRRSKRGHETEVFSATLNRIRGREEKDELIREAILKKTTQEAEDGREKETPPGHLFPDLASTGNPDCDALLMKNRDILVTDLDNLDTRKDGGFRGERIDMDIQRKIQEFPTKLLIACHR